jgi:hypothetical protein
MGRWNSRPVLSVLAVTCVSGLAAAGPSVALAAGPVIVHSQVREVVSPDGFFIDVCGVSTSTTIKEDDTLKTWPDGSQTFHTDRSFIPADLRLPVERGAETSYFAPGTDIPYRIVGKPIQLISRGGGVLALDAARR